jgi:flagellar hook protein FlgE
MSLYSAMLAGVTGLQANSSALAAISDNIANVNTVGYKANDVTFETLVTNMSGGSYSAGGVNTINQQLVTQQGSSTQTSSPTDLAIAGQGMFVTATSPAVISGTNAALFTRAGSFTPDSSGNLVNSAGLYLMGWPADAAGAITTTSALSSLAPINVNALAGAVSPTTTASVSGNLNASQAVSAQATAAAAIPPAAGAYNATANSMTAYDPTAGAGVKPDFTMRVAVSDSLGGQHNLQVDFLKSGTPNQWYAEVQSVPTSDVVSGAGLATGQIAAGVVAFKPDGSLDMTNTTLFGTPANPNLSIGASSAGAPAAGQVNWASSLGIASQTIGLDITGAKGGGGLTQYASASTTGAVTANGTTFGGVESVSVDKYGVVSANFSNGVSRQIAQVAMATFPNADGLSTVNGDAYQTTTASGALNLKAAGTGGAGTIASSALEASTVDLSSQFTAMISAQSAYSASSKVIVTANQMTQTLLAIIQG